MVSRTSYSRSHGVQNGERLERFLGFGRSAIVFVLSFLAKGLIIWNVNAKFLKFFS
jgi:hypothetical protein